MAAPPSQLALYKEGRLELAVQAYKKGSFKSYSAAAAAYDVNRSTLQNRVAGRPAQRGSTSKRRLLTPTEEESLLQWVLSRDRRGMPPRVATVRQMASLLLARPGKTSYVGKTWVIRFIHRHESIKAQYNRKYDYQRAKCEDPVLIRDWFQRVQRTIAEYGIIKNDIYNFNETGFQMGVISTAKVVTGTDRAGRPRSTQPGNREWVTVIEAVGALGFTVPPLVIFEAVMHQGIVVRGWAYSSRLGNWR
jgi:hypothetical protein